MNFNLGLGSAALPVNLTIGAYRVATLGHVGAAVGIIGEVADALGSHQPLLDTFFGNQKGALAALALVAISHFASTIAAHGQPMGAPEPPSQVNVSAIAAPVTESAPKQ